MVTVAYAVSNSPAHRITRTRSSELRSARVSSLRRAGRSRVRVAARAAARPAVARADSGVLVVHRATTAVSRHQAMASLAAAQAITKAPR